MIRHGLSVSDGRLAVAGGWLHTYETGTCAACWVLTFVACMSLPRCCICAGPEAGQGKALEALGSVQRSAPERAAAVQW